MADEEADGLRLHFLVSEGAWADVLVRLRTHPHEASHVIEPLALQSGRFPYKAPNMLRSDSNVSALHLACLNRVPPPVVQAFLGVQPRSAETVTFQGKSPLALACASGARTETVITLASAYPDAVLLQDYKGRTVFHFCCLQTLAEDELSDLVDAVGPERTAEALLKLDRRARAPIHLACGIESPIRRDEFYLLYQFTRIDSLALKPLTVLCNGYQRNIQRVLHSSPLPTTPVSTDDPTLYCNPQRAVSPERFWMWRPMDALLLRRYWNMAFTLLGADGQDMATYPLLHECLERDPACLSDMFDCVLSLNPHYACQIHNEVLPLHVVVGLATQGGERHWVRRIQTLVQLYPKGASIPDQEGHLPLELIARPTVLFDHVHPVLEGCPSSLARLNLHESLYPHMLSQLVAREAWDSVYHIIRDTPTLTRSI